MAFILIWRHVDQYIDCEYLWNPKNDCIQGSEERASTGNYSLNSSSSGTRVKDIFVPT
jgi:hypothetical protein